MGKKPGAKAAEAGKADKAKKATEKGKGKAAGVEFSEDHTGKKAKATKKAPKAEKKTESRDKRHCKMTSCKRRYRAKGYCVHHYRLWRHGEFGPARYKTCKDDAGCRKAAALNRHGYCEDHFQNYYVKGMEVVHTEKAAAPEKPAAKAEPKEAASA